MMMIAPFGILAALAVLGLLVAGVIALLVMLRGRGLAWVLGILAVLALLAVPAMVLHRYRSAAVPAMMPANSADDKLLEELQRIEQGDAPKPVETSTPPADEDMSAFLADVYPSAEQAVRAAARSVAGSIGTVAADQPGLPPVRVTGRGVSSEMLHQAAAAFGDRGALVGHVEVDAPGPEAPATRPGSDAKVVCDVQVDAAQQGTARVVLRGPTGEVPRAADFRTTPWAADFGRYSAAGPAGQRVLAQSRRPCTSLREAQRAALDDAAGQLLPSFEQAVTVSLAQQGQTRPTWLQGPQLRQTLAREIERSGAMIIDRFPQRYPRPYGEIWRQTLLVNASPAVVDGAAQRFAAVAIAMHGAQASTWDRLAMSIGGLAVLILAVYLVLNAATKGYYALVLRLAAVALVVAGTIVVFCIS